MRLHGSIETWVKSWEVTSILLHSEERRNVIFTRKWAGAKQQGTETDYDFRQEEIISAWNLRSKGGGKETWSLCDSLLWFISSLSKHSLSIYSVQAQW